MILPSLLTLMEQTVELGTNKRDTSTRYLEVLFESIISYNLKQHLIGLAAIHKNIYYLTVSMILQQSNNIAHHAK